MHPSTHAQSRPDHVAYKLVPNGETVTYRELDERSNQAAHLWRSLGLKRGDGIAILMENNARYYELAWACDRSGLYFTCVSSRLSAAEAAYIVRDSGAGVLLSSKSLLEVARGVAAEIPELPVYVVDGPAEGMRDYLAERDAMPITSIADESCGAPMLYSSGTTGRPKGVRFDLREGPIDGPESLASLAIEMYRFNADMIYLSPAPMYHSAPLRFSMAVHRVGGTVVAMERFDAEYALRLIEQERVTHSQWVPTHFIRMLKLPPEARGRYELSSHQLAFHAAAPCPVPVKQAMLDWWGPIIYEYYAATEFNGLTMISPEEWRSHPGSVGKARFGTIHILSDSGAPLPPRTDGLIYFEGGTRFAYYKDPAKTAEAYNDKGWSAVGDIGWVDEEGYLYLTDRKSFMIISGGVNLYPQEIENVIVNHPKVTDVAVIGAPDEDLGEKIVAVVQPSRWSDAGPALAAEIQAYVLSHLSKLKVPRQVDFVEELPRHPTGKLHKRELRDRYWPAAPQAR